MPSKKDNSSPINSLLKRSKKHTGRVKWLRRVLPIAGGIAILFVLLWSSLETFFEKKIEGIPDKARQLIMHNKVIQPRIKSTDSKGNPYTIRAESATQEGGAKASFEKPCCEIVGEKGQQIKLKSDTGVLDREKKEFTYEGHVHLETNDGYTFDTKKATVDLNSQKITGEDPVVGKGPAGVIRSEKGFILEKKSQRIQFKGRTKLTIHPKKMTKEGGQ